MGGADSQLLAAARELCARGHDVLIVSLTPLGPMGLRARSLGITTESLEMPRGIPDPRGLMRLIRLVRAWRPDVLHSHMVHANLMARALRLVTPVPALVSTIHNIYEGGPLWMAAYRLTNGLVDHMTIISEAAADRFVRERIVPRELLRVVSNGVDPEPYRQVPSGARDELRQALGLGQRIRVAGGWTVRGRQGLPEHAAGVRDGPRAPSRGHTPAGRPRIAPGRDGIAGARAEARRGGAVSRSPGGRAGTRERRRRLRDVLRVGGHADGAAGSRGWWSAHRRRPGSEGITKPCWTGRAASWRPPGTTRLWHRRCCG